MVLGSVVSYANEAKTSLLGVKEETIAAKGAVSEACAIEMAEGCSSTPAPQVRLHHRNRRPEGNREKPVGTVCFGFAGRGRTSEAVTVHLSNYGRSSVRRKATTVALLLARQFIDGCCLLDTVSKWQYI